MILKLAWRNIWRNKRRTFITASSVLFAVLFAISMQSLEEGAWDNMIENVVNFYYGYAQIHQEGYWDEQTIERSFELDGQTDSLPQKVREIESLVPRLESFALASHGDLTFGTLVVGIDPQKEDALTGLRERVKEGMFLEAGEDAALVGTGLADNLHIGIGDTIVLISQGYHGANAAAKYPVKGLVGFGAMDMANAIVMLPLSSAQYFYAAPGRVTSLAVQLGDRRYLDKVVSRTRSILPDEEYEVMDWQELLPELVRAKQADTGANYIISGILYLIIAFGIFGTVLMMTKEREYEYGVLISIGMGRLKLAFTVWLELVMIALLGCLAGMLVAWPLMYYFHVQPIELGGEMAEMYRKWSFEPIIPAKLDIRLFYLQAIFVFLIALVIGIYPIRKIKRLHPVEAMRA